MTGVTIEPLRSWRPVLEGALADRASEAIRAIAAQLQDPPPSINASLTFGYAGLAVLYDYLPRELCSFDPHQVSERYLDLAIECVAKEPMSASFFGGFSGVAWAMEHLRARSNLITDDSNADIDEALHALVQRSPWTGPYELTRGLVGLGVYALERLPRPIAVGCLTAVVDRLEELSERHAEGWLGERSPNSSPWQLLTSAPTGTSILAWRTACRGR